MTTAILLLLVGLAGVVMLAMIRWARRGGRAVMFVAATLFGFIGDPVAEKQIRIIQETREDREAEDPSGAPPPDAEDDA